MGRVAVCVVYGEPCHLGTTWGDMGPCSMAVATASSQIFAQLPSHPLSFSANVTSSQKPSLATHLKEPPPHLVPVSHNTLLISFKAYIVLIALVCCLSPLPNWTISSVGRGLCLPLSLRYPLYPAQCLAQRCHQYIVV